jgi:hypothetical protein
MDLYTDYLIVSTGQASATNLSRLTGGTISHDKITRLLSSEELNSKVLWKCVKPMVQETNDREAILIFDDFIIEKPYTDENEIIGWHYDHSKGRSVKGSNLMTVLWYSERWKKVLPICIDCVKKGDADKDGRRKNIKSKNEHYREMMRIACTNVVFRYVVNDVWYACAENMRFIKKEMNKDFVMPLKANRKVALSEEDKKRGKYVNIKSLSLEEGETMKIYLEGVDFPLLLVKQVFKNKDGSIGTLYLVSSDMNLHYFAITTIYQKRWKVEEYHKSLQQNVSIEKSPAKIEKTQWSHYVASVIAYVKLEVLKNRLNKNHFALKSLVYIKALIAGGAALQQLYNTAGGYNVLF